MGSRIHLVLSYAYGAPLLPSGRVDATAVARAAGVAPGTVRRWARRLPTKRRRELEELMLPSSGLLEQEERELRYARNAIADIAAPGDPSNPSWREQGWLEPHLLAVVKLERLGVCVARIARATGDVKSRERLRAGGGVVIDQDVFQTRFEAQIAKGELLQFVQRWRLLLPHGTIPRGRTEAWLEAAPRRSVAWLADHPKEKLRGRRRSAKG